MQATIVNKEFRSVKSQSELLTNELQASYEEAKTNLDAQKTTSIGEVATKTNASIEEVVNTTSSKLKNIKTVLDSETKSALNKIAVAQVVEIWNENYLEQIEYCENKLYGNNKYLKLKKSKENIKENRGIKKRNVLKWFYNHTMPFAPRRFWLLVALGVASAIVCSTTLSVINAPSEKEENKVPLRAFCLKILIW